MAVVGFLRQVIARRERLSPAAVPLVPLPIVLFALLKVSEFGAHLLKARDGSIAWCFGFSPMALLQARDDSDWRRQKGLHRRRREIG